jgi:hypothetical protein
MTPLGIEPAIVRLVAQCLAYVLPPSTFTPIRLERRNKSGEEDWGTRITGQMQGGYSHPECCLEVSEVTGTGRECDFYQQQETYPSTDTLSFLLVKIACPPTTCYLPNLQVTRFHCFRILGLRGRLLYRRWEEGG